MSYVYDYENPIDGTSPSTILLELYNALQERSNIWGLQSEANSVLGVIDIDPNDFSDPIYGLESIYRAIVSLSTIYKDNSYISLEPNLSSINNLDESFFKYKSYAQGSSINEYCTNNELYDKIESIIGFEPVFFKTFNSKLPSEYIRFSFKNPQELGGIILSTDILFEIYNIINKCFTHCLYMSDYQDNTFKTSNITKDNTFRANIVYNIPRTLLNNTLLYGDGTKEEWSARGFYNNSSGNEADALNDSYINATNNIVLESTSQNTLQMGVELDHLVNNTGSSYAGQYLLGYEDATIIRVTRDSLGNIINNPDIECWQIWSEDRFGDLYPNMGIDNIPNSPNQFELMTGVYASIDGFDSWGFTYPSLDDTDSSIWDKSTSGSKQYRTTLWTMVCAIKINKPEVVSYYAE